MKKTILAVVSVLVSAVPLFAQDPCSQNAPLSGGTSVPMPTGSGQATGTISGGDTHYELWYNTSEANNLNPRPDFTMKYYGANVGGGSAFNATWKTSGQVNYLARVGYYWNTNGKSYDNYKNIYTDFNFEVTGTGGNWSYFGIYGWTRNPTGQGASGMSLIEYYIVENWFNAGQLGPGTVCPGKNCQSLGTINVDGGTYNIYTNIRSNEPSISGNSTFLQIFSVRQYANNSGPDNRRKCGTISVTEHFRKWESLLNLKLGNFHEVKFKVEVGGGNGSFDARYLRFSQEENPRTGDGSGSSSSSSAVQSSSSSATPRVQATTCLQDDLVTYGTVPDDPYSACFKHTDNKCYTCKIDNEGDGNTCASSWLWNSTTNVDDNLDLGYWYYEVPCPGITGSSSSSGSPDLESSSSSGGPISFIRMPQRAEGNHAAVIRNGVSLQAQKGATIEVFGLNGTPISRQTFSGGVYSISFGHLNKGVYLVRATFGSDVKTLRVPVL